MQEENKILILGMGNDILTDDGIGIKITKFLEKNFPFPNIVYDTLSLGGLEIIEYIREFKMVIIIDAIKTLNGIPGTVYQFIPDDFKETTHLSNIHDVSFLTSLKLAKELDITTPENIHIIAVEIIEDMIFSDEFTPLLQEKYPEILKEVTEMVEGLLKK
ncbi:MAG TPA: hydrogenase maturation protease [Bacteroidales bacterium]|nr:hydrogenase maturation protease [Bacteroidales bacterium]HPS18475.1 hydrogenase maturation protease [Bacteroidales bacterium]